MAQIVLANLTDVPLLGPSTSVTSTGTYSAAAAGYYWINRAVNGVLAFHLPLIPTTMMLVAVKDVKGDAGNYAINISDPNGNLIDGESQLSLTSPHAGAVLVWNDVGWSQIA